MAIKKGAFESYVQERQLPKKSEEKTSRQVHFFDNPIISGINPQIVNQGLTSSQSKFSCIEAKASASEITKGLKNGSQIVHKRFTSSLAEPSCIKAKASASEINKGLENSSQMVHYHPIEDQRRELSLIKFSRLIGNQRDIVVALYKNIYMNDSVTTKELTLDELSILSGVNKKSLKNTLFRLNNAGFIIRSDQKLGRGGWVKYSLNSLLNEEIKNIGILSNIKKK